MADLNKIINESIQTVINENRVLRFKIRKDGTSYEIPSPETPSPETPSPETPSPEVKRLLEKAKLAKEKPAYAREQITPGQHSGNFNANKPIENQTNSEPSPEVKRLLEKAKLAKEKQREDAQPAYAREQITPGQHATQIKSTTVAANKPTVADNDESLIEKGVKGAKKLGKSLNDRIHGFLDKTDGKPTPTKDNDIGIMDKVKNVAKKAVEDHPYLAPATAAGLAAVAGGLAARRLAKRK